MYGLFLWGGVKRDVDDLVIDGVLFNLHLEYRFWWASCLAEDNGVSHFYLAFDWFHLIFDLAYPTQDTAR